MNTPFVVMLVALLAGGACALADRAPEEPEPNPTPSSAAAVVPETAGIPIAVHAFDNASGQSELEPLGAGLAQMLVTDLARSDDLVVVERHRISAVLGELDLQASPFVDPASAVQLGKGVGAAFIVTGSFVASSDDLRIDARTIDVESGEVVVAASVQGREDELFGLHRSLSSRLLDELGAELSPIASRRVGSHGTNDVEALTHYGEALEASDRGDRDAERAAIVQALAEDPGFGAATERLEELGLRVERLERSGGLVVDATTWQHHVNNLQAYLAMQDTTAARASLLAAVELDPQRVELWTLASQLPEAARRGLGNDLPSMSLALRTHIQAYLAEEKAPIASTVLEGGEAADAALLLWALLAMAEEETEEGWLTWADATAIVQASERFGASENRALLEALALEPDALLEDLTTARGKLTAEPSEDRVLENWRFDERLSKEGPCPVWDMFVQIPDQPSSDLSVTVRPDRDHPGAWERPPYSPPERFGEVPFPRAEPEQQRAIADALEEGSDQVYALPWTDDYFYGCGNPTGILATPRIAPEGVALSFNPDEVGCSAEWDQLSPAGSECGVWIELYKHAVPPGPYQVTATYTDRDGIPQQFGPERLWTPEFVFFRFGHDWATRDYWRDGREIWQMNLDSAWASAGWKASLTEWSGTRARLDGEEYRWLARACWHPGPTTPDGLPPAFRPSLIAWDSDYSLNRGQPPATDQAWIDYGAKLLKSGDAAEPDEHGCAYVFLPELTPGPHEICLTAQLTRSVTSVEPSCEEIDIPKPKRGTATYERPAEGWTDEPRPAITRTTREKFDGDRNGRMPPPGEAPAMVTFEGVKWAWLDTGKERFQLPAELPAGWYMIAAWSAELDQIMAGAGTVRLKPAASVHLVCSSDGMNCEAVE